MLGVALSGVRATRMALEQIADNVANAATPGHVRRSVQVASLLPPASLSPFALDRVGAGGVDVRGIVRAADLIRQDSLRRTEGDVAMLGASERWLSLVQSSLTGPASLAQPISDLFASLSDLASDPTSIAVRATFLARADALADRFNASAADLRRLESDLKADADVEATRLTSLGRALADVNLQIRRATPGSGAAAGLADRRDKLLLEMTQIATIDVRFEARGMAIVRVGDAGGPLLVDGPRSEAARVERAPDGGLMLRLGPQGSDEVAPLLGGSLAGLSVARTLLIEAGSRLDALADRIAADMNAAHTAGADSFGADGQPLFATLRVIPEPARGNAGDARIFVKVADGAAPGPLTLSFNGVTSEWTLARADNSAAVTGSMPLALDGVTVEAAGTARGGDLFQLVPKAGAAGIALRPLAPAEVAAAPRWLADPAPGNQGVARAEIRRGSPLDPPPVPPLVPPFAVHVRAGLLELRDAADTLVASGAVGDWLAGDGFAIRVTGRPADEDRFRVRLTEPGQGGNGNAVAMLALRDVEGPLGTIEDSHDRLVAGIAVPLSETRMRSEAARANRDAAAEALAQASGVDLNREAAEMLLFQQAYQANSRIIQTARETFAALLQSVGG
ncbi:flagellar hook-associated protein FlgK [Thermaurantiacus sp.]